MSPAVSVAKVWLLITVKALAVPAVANVPLMSSRHLATDAISARAESFTAEGAMPSAQFTLLSAVALFDGVFDQLCTPVGIALLPR
jgi:hypothetical protein